MPVAIFLLSSSLPWVGCHGETCLMRVASTVFLVRIDSSTETTSKHMAAAEKHNRCVVDAGRFHYLVIDIPPDTICPRCDLIFNDTAELQRHLASKEFPPPKRHSLVTNAETSVGACGSALWQRIRDRWRARRAERETKTRQIEPGGTKDYVTMGSMSSGQKGTAKGANKSTDAKLRNAVLKTFCVLSRQVRDVRGAVFMCWMIKQEAPEYKKPKEQLRAYSELAATKGKGHGLGPPGIAAFTGLLQALSERGSTVGAANAAGVANLKQTWDDMEPEGAFDLVPHCKLAKVYDPALSPLEPSAWHNKHSWGTRTNRSESSSRSSSKRSLGTGTVSSYRIELKKVNFVAASRPDSPIRTPSATACDWKTGANRRQSLTSGQLLTSAEIEEVREFSCGVLDLEFDFEEDAAREMYSTLRTKWLASCTLSSTSDRWQACMHGIRSRRRAVTD